MITRNVYILVAHKFTMKVKVTRNFQVTIPAPIRAKLGIKEGDYVEVQLDEINSAIIIRPYRRRWTTIKLGKKINTEEIDEIIEKVNEEIANSR